MGSSRLSRHLTVVFAFLVGAVLLVPAQAGAGSQAGEHGSGPGPSLPGNRVSFRFTDVGPSYAWAAPAIKYVAVNHPWMADFGTDKFHPKLLETRLLFARALVEAFAPNESIDKDIHFTDLPDSDPLFQYANVAVKMRWMLRTTNGAFRPASPVTMTAVHQALVEALGLDAEVAGLDAIHTADGYAFAHPVKFPYLLLGMVLHFRYNHPTEGNDVGPTDPLPRVEVAYSLWRAATTTDYQKAALKRYDDIQLPAIVDFKRKVVEFGLGYVGYPYIWGGEWYRKTPPGYCCGAQPTGGFDCSGLMWWTVKKPAGGYDNHNVRGYLGWPLPQRVSADMASVGKHIPYAAARPGDLMFYDGDDNGQIDHVDLFLGNGWALDSSSGQGGVTILRVGEGWYHDHFVHARQIMP